MTQIINARTKKLDTLKCPDARHGDVKLNVYPFKHRWHKGFDEHLWVRLPEGFERWEVLLNTIIDNYVPHQEVGGEELTHYVTIDSKFFTLPESLRREGLHIDGNFCCDPKFARETWGGGGTWAGVTYNHKTGKPQADWVSPYMKIEDIPIGDYVSDTKGGIICVSSYPGCRAWQGRFEGDIGDGGDCSELQQKPSDVDRVTFEKDEVYFMTSNTPHESLVISKGTRRTFMRITLDHRYKNAAILDKTPEEVK